MNRTAALLDKAKTRHHLASDYKLALVMGISHSALTNYRSGKTLPDSRVVAKICELTDDDSALIAVEMEAERATSPEAKKIWQNVYARLQAGHAQVENLILIAIILIAGYALFSGTAAELRGDSGSVVYYVKCVFASSIMRFTYKLTRLIYRNVKLCKSAESACITA